MTEKQSLPVSLQYYEKALSFFNAGHFAKAQQLMRAYRRTIDYTAFEIADNRSELPGHASVIIITRDRGKELIDCLNSLTAQAEQQFEIIVVNNGSKNSIRNFVSNKKILLIECPFPFTPSEGRNIGAFYARADLLLFLDDDALAEPGFVKSAVTAFETHAFLGIRGRILPKSPQADNSLAGLYDLGQYPLPAILDIEGNFAVPKKAYHAVQGMNPLLFGAEGTDFTARLLQARPDGEVYYWPGMVIRHDYASGDNLLAKRKRQALTHEYFRTMHPAALKVKEKYTRVFDWRRENKNGSFLKVLPTRIRNFSKDMNLALKSEKKIYDQATFLTNDSSFYKNTDKMTNRALSQKESAALLQHVQSLEIELEEIRKTLSARMATLFHDAKSAPLRQGLIFPVRLVRLIKEHIAKSS